MFFLLAKWLWSRKSNTKYYSPLKHPDFLQPKKVIYGQSGNTYLQFGGKWTFRGVHHFTAWSAASQIKRFNGPGNTFSWHYTRIPWRHDENLLTRETQRKYKAKSKSNTSHAQSPRCPRSSKLVCINPQITNTASQCRTERRFKDTNKKLARLENSLEKYFAYLDSFIGMLSEFYSKWAGYFDHINNLKYLLDLLHNTTQLVDSAP